VIRVALAYPPGYGPARAAAIRVEFAGSAHQDRLTVFIRLILTVPHVICLGIAALATQITIVGGWLVPLVMGRRSAPATEYLVGYHQWKTRLRAYLLLLLTDKYPPVGWRNDLYPVDVAVRPADPDGRPVPPDPGHSCRAHQAGAGMRPGGGRDAHHMADRPDPG
jgi:hypothetical protein